VVPTLFLGFRQSSKFFKLRVLNLDREPLLRRLFSTFARGSPGIGLLLLRLAVGISLIWQAVEKLTGEPFSQATTLFVLAIGLGLLLIIGLWTPMAATLVAVVELCKVLWKAGDPLTYILLGTIGAALALLGPGLWSVDARIYGWKRIEPTHPKA
jgi:uncharacterized membrane protein YphA (DoxX/SURF4 family)